ncbi:hypothetical protein LCL90_13830 [Bacillus infantis]|uniref:hypothetical protein n=1 Tax=Bacillus infantis TaxID=324767 RepID=UPI001CD39ECA|nr:hypothetical protein [Bacillus infantis]MCA1035713.1 hypothetical protein [Bacillus infantis]
MSTTQLQSVLYRPKKGTSWENYEINMFIQELLTIIENNSQYFLVISNILERYNDPDNDDETKNNRNLDLVSITKLYPQTKDNVAETQKLIEALDNLYSKSSQDLGNIRGKVLEAVIYKYAPKNFSISPNTVKCLESIISYGEDINVLGGNGCDFDFTYHDNNGSASTVPDYFECKATIDGMVKINEPMSQLKPQKLKKWEYARGIFNDLLRCANMRPNIYFACFNSRTEDIQSHVSSEGYDCVVILNNKDIYRMMI